MYLEEFSYSTSEEVIRRKKFQTIGPNQLLWDLGVDDIYNDQEVQERINLMEDTFHLVMILEKFEVSQSFYY